MALAETTSLTRYHTGITTQAGDGWLAPERPDDGSLPQYIISDDLGDIGCILALSPRFPNVVSEQTLNEVRSTLADGLLPALDSSHLHYINVHDMHEDLREKTLALNNRHGAIAVSMDTHYLQPNPIDGIYSLKMTRMYDGKTGERIGRGPRPMSLGIIHQIEAIAEAAQGRPVILAESGVVTGGSIVKVVEQLKEKGVEVKGLCVGIAMMDALEVLQKKYPLLEIETLVGLENYTDWTEARDLLLFVPDSGQTVGEQIEYKNQKHYVPIFDQNAIAGYTIPYPLGRINRWATLSERGTAIMRVAGLKASKLLFEGVEAANGSTAFTFDDLLVIGDRIQDGVKVTMPWMLAGYGKLAQEITPNTRVVDLLDRLLMNRHTLSDNTEVLLPESVTSNRLYPGGNETILVTTPVDRIAYPEVARRLLTRHTSAEQVGFVENLGSIDPNKRIKLQMAGGEFCGNATRSLIYLLHHTGFKNETGDYEIEVSGARKPLRGHINEEDVVSIEMPIRTDADAIIKIDGNSSLVHLDGISHVVVYSTEIDNKTPEEAAFILTAHKLKSQPAAGVIYVEQTKQGLRMNPYVYVSALETFYNETGCASGATAVAMLEALSQGHSINLPIQQKSGHYLIVDVQIEDDAIHSVIISGKISYLGNGDTNIQEI